MRSFVKAVGLAGTLAMALLTAGAALPAAQLDNLAQRQPVITELSGTASAMTYWVSEDDGWHVVTTVQLAVGEDDPTPKYLVVRFSSVLLPGQSQLISVPVALGEQQQLLRIRRIDDRIEVQRLPGV